MWLSSPKAFWKSPGRGQWTGVWKKAKSPAFLLFKEKYSIFPPFILLWNNKLDLIKSISFKRQSHFQSNSLSEFKIMRSLFCKIKHIIGNLKNSTPSIIFLTPRVLLMAFKNKKKLKHKVFSYSVFL